MKGMDTNDSDAKCPVMHGAISAPSSGMKNNDWWPNQMNLEMLH